MNSLILGAQFIPVLGFLFILLFGQSEDAVARISLLFTHLLGLVVFALLAVWAFMGFPSYEFEWFTLYKSGDYHFPLVFLFDKISAVYLFCTSAIFSVIVRYCRYYLHREAGYKRFFLTIFGFISGLNMAILSGVLDMFFAGWEVVGISSFLLIAFYRHRVQPIRNAQRAYSIYRLCDFGLLLAALLLDLLVKGHNHFLELDHALDPVRAAQSLEITGLSMLLVLAASGKSAQFPFCFWIPRAMEGPTPSSAIFYGALSVHLGVYLLLRTEAVWGDHLMARFIIGGIGLTTVVVSTVSEKAQSNIKGQIAYASIAQVGLMFVELALGLHALVLIHFLGNAFLRSYQLLVSPSIITHRLRTVGATDTRVDLRQNSFMQQIPAMVKGRLSDVLETTLQVIAVQEFNLEAWVRSLLWDSFRHLGMVFARVNLWLSLIVISGMVLLGYGIYASGFSIRPYLAGVIAVVMLILSVLGFTRKRNPFRTWNAVCSSTVLAGFSTYVISGELGSYLPWFFGTIAIAWLLGLFAMLRMRANKDYEETPFAFRAMAERAPFLTLLLFFAFLGVVGFPVTPAFVGQDLILYYTSSQHAWLTPLIAIALVLNGISAAGIFTRMAMGLPYDLTQRHMHDHEAGIPRGH